MRLVYGSQGYITCNLCRVPTMIGAEVEKKELHSTLNVGLIINFHPVKAYAAGKRLNTKLTAYLGQGLKYFFSSGERDSSVFKSTL